MSAINSQSFVLSYHYTILTSKGPFYFMFLLSVKLRRSIGYKAEKGKLEKRQSNDK